MAPAFFESVALGSVLVTAASTATVIALAVQITPDHAVSIIETAVPTPGEGEILVCPRACGICGTDLYMPRRGFPGSRARGVIVGRNIWQRERGPAEQILSKIAALTRSVTFNDWSPIADLFVEVI